MSAGVPVEQTVKDLASAAGLIRKEGWGQGSFRQVGTGRLCAVGALYEAVGVRLHVYVGELASPSQRERLQAAASAVVPLLGLGVDPDADDLAATRQLVYFNDKYCRGGEEMAGLFEQAAEKLEAEL